MGVTGRGLDFEDTALDGQKGNIEGTATKVENEDVLLGFDLLVETVCDGSGGGLIDDTEDIETGDDTGVLGGLSLGVIKVGGHGDDGACDGATKVRLCNLLHLGEDH